MLERKAVTRQRDWWVAAGLAVSAASAAISSFGALRGLALAAGWPVRSAPLLPITVDAYAATATRVWLSSGTRSHRARRFARANALSAIVLSLTGNAVYHLIAAGLLAASWEVVVVVGAVPALILGLVSHLAVLHAEVEPAGPAPDHLGPEDVPSPNSGQPEDDAGPVRSYRSDAELLEAAREADQLHRQSHGGRPIPRDELRRRLRVGGAKATELRRQLGAEQAHAGEGGKFP